MQNGFGDFDADIEDFKLHANLYFPEVRLRNFIEIRNHDCVGKDMIYAVLAIYKGILYNEGAMNEIEELLSGFSYRDFAEFRYNVPKNALQAKVRGIEAYEVVKDILYIAEKSLIEMNTREEKFIEPIKELALEGLCPADIIIRNWNGLWNRDVKKLVKYLSR